MRVDTARFAFFIFLGFFSGFDGQGKASDAPLWIEAEAYAAQSGSTAQNYAMENASGGAIVDNDWGGRQGDFLRYNIALPRAFPQVHIALRYARAMSGDALVQLCWNGKQVATLPLPQTGGWGFTAEQWRFAHAVLPAASAGKHVLEIRSLRNRGNVNFDGLYVCEQKPALKKLRPPKAPVKLDFQGPRRAIQHLSRQFGKRYPDAKIFLHRLAQLEKRHSAQEAGADLSEDHAALMREALVKANPLLDFERLLFTRRRPLGGQHYAYTECLSWNTDRPRFWRPGASLCTIDPRSPENSLDVLLDSPEGVIRDPDVHYDGKRILFAHKKNLNHDDYHLYEMDVDSRLITQLTHDEGFADYEGAYLPGGDIIFNSTRCVQTVDCFPVPVSNLYLMDGGGGNIHRLTVNHVHDNFPSVLPDGRVMFTRWEYNDRWVLHVQGLAVMNPDGTGAAALYGNNSYWPISMLHARAVPGTDLLVATLSGHHDVDQCGEIGLFNPALGNEESTGCVKLWPDRPIKPIKDEFYWRRLKTQYQYPYPLSPEFFLVSGKPRGERRFGIYLIDVFDNQVLICQADDISLSSPMPVAPRRRPPVLPGKVDYSVADATVYMADVCAGPGLRGIKRGTVKALRIIEMLNRPTGTRHWAGMDGTPPMGICSSWDAKRVVGVVPVADDGSAHFKVPAGTALYFQPLDGKGRALQWMRSWVTLQPGERQSCVGCHDARNTAPEKIGSAGVYAMSGASVMTGDGMKPLHPETRYPDPFSFHKEVQPVLDRACVSCHDHNHPRGIDLRGDKTDGFSLGYEHFRRFVQVPGTRQDPPVIPPKSQGAIASRVIAMLEAGHHKVKLTEPEWDRLVTWIDLNAPYYGTYAITRYTANFGRCVVEDASALWRVLGKRCFGCHKQKSSPPGVPEGGFSRFDKHAGRDFVWATKDRYDTSNAVLVNLTHPEQSRLLRAPLAKAAGGLGLHKKSPFESVQDPVYQAALKEIRSWGEALRQAPREDMPGAVPCDAYKIWQQKREDSMAIEQESRRRLAQQQKSDI